MSKLRVLLCVLLGACAHDPVVRVMDGHAVSGRFIDERAYDAYLRGSILEQEGQLAEAEAAFQMAHESDSEGISPLVRLAAVRCARGPERYRASEEAFEAAERLQVDYAPLQIERARCAMARGRLEQAERELHKAITIDPKDEEATVLLAQVLQRTARAREAASILFGFAIWRLGTSQSWKELEAMETRAPGSVEPWMLRLRPARASDARKANTAPRLERLDAAIARGDMQEAKAQALQWPRGAAVVAVRAAALGRWSVALQEASLVLAADPWDPDARAVAISVPDQQQVRATMGEGAWSRLLGTAADPPRPSALAALVLADALRRRAGADAARAFLDGYGEIRVDPADALARSLRQRLAR